MDNISLPIPQFIFKDLDVSEYVDIFNNKNTLNGGALTDIALFKHNNYSNLFKKEQITGARFWSFLSGLAKKSYPIIKKFKLPEALNLTSSVIEKVKEKSPTNITKSDIKDLAKENLKNLAKKTLSSSGGRI